MTMDLFAGIPVRDYNAAVAWYERLLGAAPSFLPDHTEAVWEVADHQYVYIDVRRAGLTETDDFHFRCRFADGPIDAQV